MRKAQSVMGELNSEEEVAEEEVETTIQLMIQLDTGMERPPRYQGELDYWPTPEAPARPENLNPRGAVPRKGILKFKGRGESEFQSLDR